MRYIKLKRHLIIKLSLLCSVFALFAFIPRADDTPFDKLVAALQKWTTDNPQEKVYLQFDKPYYAIGDTIWFKGYITTGSRHQLSALSASVYVDLINEQDSVIRALKLPATSGMVMGDFTLGDEMKTGNYRIRAYTQWMRNAGEEYFFDKTFTIGSVFNNNIVTKADYKYKDVDGKSTLTATLNYTDEQGKPLADKNVLYRIVIDKAVVWTKTAKTDANGSIAVNIANERKADLTGAYIRTILSNNAGKEITRDFPIKASLSQSDIQFFPESGNLVNGALSRVGFKAVGVDGLGINISGSIVDNDNKEVADITTLHAGMGSFFVRPEANKIYTAKIKFTDGSSKDIALPKALDDGYVLGIYQPNKDSILVRVTASANKVAQAGSVNLMVQAGGEVITTSTVKIERAMNSFWLDRRAFPTGIVQFTLFDNNNQPLNERIAFIRSNDLLQLNIQTAKKSYKSKEPVFFSMDALNSAGKAAIGNYSVSVIDESKVPSDEANETTILSNLLLTSDIKGYVEKPNYYFTNVNYDVNRALDNLMLTQGYRRFSWKELISPTATTNPTIKFPAEGLGIAISGKVQTLSKKPLANATVTLLSVKARITKFVSTDSLGRFTFDGIFLTDSIKFTVQGRGAKNSDKVMVVLDSIPGLKVNKNPNIGDISTNVSATLKAYIDAGKKQDEIFEKMGRMDQVHRLRQVNIKAAKPKQEVYSMQGGLQIPPGTASKTLVPKESDNDPLLGTYLSGKLSGVSFKSYKVDGNMEVINYPFSGFGVDAKPISVVLNGRFLEPLEAAGCFDNTTIDFSDIAKIDFVNNNPAITNMLRSAKAEVSGVATSTVILIYTKPPSARKQFNPSVVNITPKGFNTAREFYSPKYTSIASTQQPDMRTTIYWNPYLKTGEDGKASFAFFNADGPGTYKVTVEGIDADGQLGRQVFRYQVDGDLAFGASAAPVIMQDDRVRQIASALDSTRDRLPIEKVYLHTDKSYYNIGDTVWFKAYLTNADHTPSKLSGLMYVELANDSSEAVRRVSLRVKDGVASGQIPLIKAIFQEGGYTLRAYTNWMQNFGEDYVFSQRFYLGVPTKDAWLARSSAGIKHVGDKDVLDVDIKLNRADKGLSSLALRKVEVKIYEGKYYLYKENMQTGIDGSLTFSKALKDKLDGRNIRVQIRSLDPADDDKIVQIPLRINRGKKTDLQFLPEGGNLVAGLKSTVGFKAIGEDGKSTSVIGEILDSKGTKVAEFMTLHGGMGSFEFTPKAGEIYTARITQPEGITQSYTLPKINSAGTVMHVTNPENVNDLSINITATSTVVNTSTDSAYYLIGTSGGRICFSQKAELNNGAITVSKTNFPRGIARFTLFKGKIPLNERLTFIDTKDDTNIRISANKATYQKRDSVALELIVKDKNGMPVQGNFSLAVTDNSQVKADTMGNNSLITGLLLNSMLKGNVEEPGYYLNRKNKNAWAALDNLMLTQGWTGYNWNDVFRPAKPPKFKVEKELKITGLVVNALNKPVPDAEVIISSQKPSFLTSINADAEGRFSFNKLPKIDSGSFFLQANNKNGKVRAFGGISVDRFTAPRIPETIHNAVLPWYVNSDTTQLNYVKRIAQRADFSNIKGLGTMLRNVDIKNTKSIKGSLSRNPPGYQDLVFDEKDIKESATINLWELLRQKLPGIRVADEHGMPTLRLNKYLAVIEIDGGGLPIYMADEMTTDRLIQELSQIQIAQLVGMEVAYSDKNMTKFQNARRHIMHFALAKPYLPNIMDSEDSLKLGFDMPWQVFYTYGYSPGYLENRANVLTNTIPDFAAIQLTTRKGNGWYKNSTPSTVTYRPLPVLYAQQFYDPKYKLNAPIAGEPDYRSTVFWEPNIITDVNGRAKVSFHTSDLPKDYSINLQGLSSGGQMVSLVQEMSGLGMQQPQGNSVDPPKPTGGPMGDDSAGQKQLASGLDNLMKKLPVEKVYLHTDKPYYNIGDTVWIKAYLTDINLRPSKQSKLLYIELNDDSTEAVRRISIPIKDGVGSAQIALPRTIFHEGGYTLRAYTNWMQNFGDSYFFSQRFYLGVPAQTAWLVKSEAAIKRAEDKDRLDVDIRLNKIDKKPVALTNVEVKVYEGKYYLFKEEMRTGVDGGLKFSKVVKDKLDGRNIRVQVTALDKADAGHIAQVPLSINRLQKIDLQFLPEGGYLVDGLKSTVAFKAIGEDGKGTDIKGAIYDSKGNKVTDFATMKYGMGAFEFTPKAGESYMAKIAQPDITGKTFEMPKVKAKGTTMHIDNPEQGTALTVTLNGLDNLPADTANYLVATARGKIVYSKKLDSKEGALQVDKSLFPAGVARFTLMRGKRPLNERLVFIEGDDKPIIRVSANKQTYNKRDSVNVEIEVKYKTGFPASGTYSLAVTDNSQVKPDSLGNYNIAAALLLKSELKGNIESPGYYLNRKDLQAWQALDNLLLTQGWTGYDWKDVFSPDKAPAFMAERDFIITGKVTNITKKPVPNTEVIVSSQKPSFVLSTTTDGEGFYKFDKLPKIDSGSFFIQTNNKNGKAKAFGNTSVDKFKPAPIPETYRDQQLPWYVNSDTSQINYVKLTAQKRNDDNINAVGTLLSNVDIKQKKIIKNSNNPYGPGNSDIAFDEKEIKASGVMNLYELLKQKLPGFRVERDFSHKSIPDQPIDLKFIPIEDQKDKDPQGQAALKMNKFIVDVAIDGVPMQSVIHVDDIYSVEEVKDILASYEIVSFKGMEVIYNRKYTNSMVNGRIGFAGAGEIAAVEITTANKAGWFKRRSPGTTTYRPMPVLFPQQFYSPKYKLSTALVGDPDYRSTIFWEPNVTLDANGKARVKFYTSDLPKNYSINLQGLSSDGQPVSVVEKMSKLKPVQTGP